jgi:uncharacterized protein (TIGR02246 family)
MKNLLILTLALALPVCASATAASSPASSSSDKAAVTKLEKEWPAAVLKKDTAKILSLGSDDCVFTDSSGAIVSLKQIASDVKSGRYSVKSMHIDQLKVRVYGDTAIVLGLETEKSQYKGKDSSGQYRFVDTWLKRNGRWVCVASANTLITPPKS